MCRSRLPRLSSTGMERGTALIDTTISIATLEISTSNTAGFPGFIDTSSHSVTMTDFVENFGLFYARTSTMMTIALEFHAFIRRIVRRRRVKRNGRRRCDYSGGHLYSRNKPDAWVMTGAFVDLDANGQQCSSTWTFSATFGHVPEHRGVGIIKKIQRNARAEW